MKNPNVTDLTMSATRALWGHVSPCLRTASVEFSEDTIYWRCLFDSDATDDDIELASMAGAELIADFSHPWEFEEDLRIVPFPEALTNLEYLVYHRHEHNYYKEE